MLSSGIRKKTELILVVVLLSACTGFDQTLDLAQSPISTNTSLPAVEPGRTTVVRSTPIPISTVTQSLPSKTPTAAQTTAPILPDVNTFLPDGKLYNWRVVESGLDRPVGVTNAGDGSQRIFILEQPGRIQIIREETLAPIPFLDIAARVGSQGFEQGLLGLAFHPDFSQNGTFFVNYTDLNGDTVIARFQVTGDNIDQADPGSEQRLLLVKQPYRNHNGGGIVFGPDGYLYIGLGDGGSAGDPQNNAQSVNSLLGKILRIDVDQGDPYGIPLDNPNVHEAGMPEIWAYGLRNPWRFSFDRLSEDLYIADVGQSQWEEINFLPAGSPGGINFGWRFFEGMHPYQDSPLSGTEITSPVAEYAHNLGCSVTGGVVYRGERLPEFQGIYLFGDYCGQRVWGLTRSTEGNWINSVLFEGLGSITSFGEDEVGEVYLVTHEGQLLILERP
ncbi:MAG: hypothetical protein A2Z16_10605 [Chloroflexi bacterium RBG_16_54_18]|nr:MAG: hypothetical protein A2Z16_10605 [Chloroflexi bacterium RBG_16_54_18]